MEYYDVNSTAWIQHVVASDTNGGSGRNTSETFTVNVLDAMNISLDPITFTGVTLLGTNFTADSNPLIVRNLGNVPLFVNITATDLAGYTTDTEFIYANNF